MNVKRRKIYKMSLPPLFSTTFPQYVKENFNNQIIACWYQKEFSQSLYPPGQQDSNACTLICLLVAQKICVMDVLITSVGYCPDLNLIMAEAIIEGNAIHTRIVQSGLISHPCLNTIEALRYGGESLNILQEWKFQIFEQKIEKFLTCNIINFLEKWYEEPKSENLFMLLITCGKTILFIFQEITYKVTIFDSHGHSTANIPNRGLVTAQTAIVNLNKLCKWILQNCYNVQVKIRKLRYELVFLYPRYTKYA